MKAQLHNFLSSLNTFSRKEVDAIVDKTTLGHFKKGSVLLREGEICRQCFFVLSGCVRQYHLLDGLEKTTAFFTEGQAAVMYSSYMNQEPSAHYLVCTEDSVLTA